MKILLCAATEMEIAPTIHYLTTNPNYSIHVLITGVGLMAATYSITKAVTEQRPDFLLQAGIAGSLDKSLPLSQVVVIENDTVGDLGVQEGSVFQSLFNMKFLNENSSPFVNGHLCNQHSLLNKLGLTKVNAVTVNQISTSDQMMDYYRHQLNAQVESMEGAALHYVGLQEKIPFLQIRSVSNFAGERDKSKWLMTEAIANLNQQVQRVFKKI